MVANRSLVRSLLELHAHFEAVQEAGVYRTDEDLEKVRAYLQVIADRMMEIRVKLDGPPLDRVV